MNQRSGDIIGLELGWTMDGFMFLLGWENGEDRNEKKYRRGWKKK